MEAINFPFKVIIVHEDSVTGLQATQVLKHLASQLENKLGTDINPWEICSHVWQFEWLRDVRLYEQAVAEAVSADMIIISAEGRGELPACVRGWIESVLPRKQGMVAALVALLGGGQAGASTTLPPARYLRELAKKYGVDFLCNLDEPGNTTASTTTVTTRTGTEAPGAFEGNWPGTEDPLLRTITSQRWAMMTESPPPA